MATLTVRDIDAADYENLQSIAKSNNRSAAAQVRDMLADLRKRRINADKAVADLKAFRGRTNWTLPEGLTSFDLLREERDSW